MGIIPKVRNTIRKKDVQKCHYNSLVGMQLVCMLREGLMFLMLYMYINFNYSDFWFPVPGSWIPDSGFQLQDSGFQIPDSEIQIPDSGFGILVFGFRFPDSGFRIPVFGFLFPDFKFRFSCFRVAAVISGFHCNNHRLKFLQPTP